MPEGGRGPVYKGFVDTMDTTLKRVNKWNTGDLMSVYGIIALIGVIVAAPIVVRHMRRSDSTYEDLDPEDPVNDMAKMVRLEYKRQHQELNDGESETTSHLGGMDSIVADLLRSPQVQKAINHLVTQVLQSPQFKKSCQILLKELWTDLVEDPETLKQVVHLLYNAIQDEQIKEAMVQLVTEVFDDKEVLDELVVLFQRLGEEKEVQDATRSLLVESAHTALNDPEILDHSMEFATDVVGDDIVQQTAGEALYNTLSYAVRPTLSVVLSIFGAGLIIFSISAFRNAASSDQGMDKALLRTLESTNVKGISKVLSMPLEWLIACKNAIISVLLSPFRLAAASLSRLGHAGNTVVSMFQRWVEWIANLPSQLVHSLSGVFQDGLRAVSAGFTGRSRQISAALSASFLGGFMRNVTEAFTSASTAILATLASSNQISTALSASFLGDFMRNVTEALTSASTAILATLASSNLAASNAASSVERFWKNIMEVFTETLSRTVSTLKATETTIATGISALEKFRCQTVRGVSDSYDTLNRLAESLGFFLEDLITSLVAKFGGTTNLGRRRI